MCRTNMDASKTWKSKKTTNIVRASIFSIFSVQVRVLESIYPLCLDLHYGMDDHTTYTYQTKNIIWPWQPGMGSW